MSFFEDARADNVLFFNTRIVRVTEAILYLLRLYSHLGVDRATTMKVRIRHGGLRGRTLTASTSARDLHGANTCDEDVSESEVEGSLDEFEASLVEKVKGVLAPLFVLFDFFVLGDEVYNDIVNRFEAGEVS